MSGLEWGNGDTSGGQWSSGEYGVFSGGWSGNHDGYQIYCTLNDSEFSITGLGAQGSNVEGNTIQLQGHVPVCETIKKYSEKYNALSL